MIDDKLIGTARIVGVAVSVLLMGMLAFAHPAMAESPFWQVTQNVAPTDIQPGGEGEVIVTATNLGDGVAEGGSNAITINDTLPNGLIATSVTGTTEGYYGTPACTASPVRCTLSHSVAPFGYVEMIIQVTAGATSMTALNKIVVTGGETPPVFVHDPVNINGRSAGFGVETVELQPFNEDGSLDTQAGSHPFELTTTIGLNQTLSLGKPAKQVGLGKDVHFALPPGLVGNPEVIPRCTEAQFTTPFPNTLGANECPNDTVIGVATVRLTEYGGSDGDIRVSVPVFNLVPDVGEPARFGFAPFNVDVYLDTAIRTGGDYGVTVNVDNISQIVGFAGSQVTFWGVPNDSVHNSARGVNCLMDGQFGTGSCGEGDTEQTVTPFLTLPTSCSGPLGASVSADSWEEPGVLSEAAYTLHDDVSAGIGLTGCNRLPFEPSISVAADGTAASTPTGLTVGIHVPQGATLTPTGLAEADVRDTTVVLPEGVALNPAAADGLEACSTGQVGFEKIDPVSDTALFSPSGASCPEASKVGTVTIKSPLLPEPLEGAAYLATQDANPFGSLVALYIVAEDPTAGVLVKLAGEVVPNPVTGQLVSTFENTPQLPFEDLHLNFFGTARAPLNTPALCGAYTTNASISPWSGNPPAESSSTFDITSGPGGSRCADPLPFAPSLTAGSTNIQAGAFSPFTLTMSREDGNQTLSGIQLHMPPGLLGLLSSVKLCKEPEAALGTCGRESLIGHTIVSVGLGGDPFSVTGGQVFITEGYKGAPYGLSIVNPAKAGPFNLGQVIVRARIEVNPSTAALTVTSDPLPTILDGIPLEIKHVNVSIDRSGFTFNPTNCQALQLGGILSSTQGASQALSVPFQVTNCATLAFKPGFKVSTTGKTSRKDGAGLTVRLTYPKAPFGSQANIAKVKVDLPKQLPSRLTTLQKACPDGVFSANPEACPPASRVGHATAITPVLTKPLSGVAYFVSHGGAAFPDLTIVLSGEGVRVDLVGSTFISKAGITSSTFNMVPDVPISSFALTLPQGPFSALAANGNLCASTLKMPTAFTAQNGLTIHQSTPVSVTGCPKHKTKKTKKANTHGKKK